MQNYTREIVTNLPNEKKYCEMIASVIGQLSDGAWEGSSRCQGYWVYAECNRGLNNLWVSQSRWDSYYNCRNPYVKMSDEQIRHYYGKKIKELVLMELEDNHKREISDLTLKDMRYCYMLKDEEEYRRRRAEYDRMMAENPFERKGKFNLNNNTELCYIGYDERITVADAYRAYKILMR